MNNNAQYAEKGTSINTERIIGVYEGDYSGPLFIAIGAMHGNEPAGVLAMQELFELIAVEPHKNPDFKFFGTLVGLKGNLKAFKQKARYIDRDLNRSFTEENIAQVLKCDKNTLQNEAFEIRDIIDTVQYFIHRYKPEKVIVLDLHTTSSKGGIFTITSETPESERIALGMYAPIVRGVLTGVKGTSLHYFNTKNLGADTTVIVLESGQHDNPMSVKYAISGIINCLRSVGCVEPIDVEARHDNLLKEHCGDFPAITKMIYSHHITPSDNFQMKPGYVSFQRVSAGEILATDSKGPVLSPYDGLILMPLYQTKGEDGFFLVEEIKN